MNKGIEIAFQLSSSKENREVVLALANLTGNHFTENYVQNWQIFHVTLEEKTFFKVLFSGKGVSKFHPEHEKEIREYFDRLSKLSQSQLMEEYNKGKKNDGFQVKDIRELEEEYDLWQDKFWNYI